MNYVTHRIYGIMGIVEAPLPNGNREAALA
jgi:hypothetical protein